MSEENLDSTTSMVHIIESGSDEEIRMLLGGRERIRHAGIIRAGKQVPIKACTPDEKALFLKLEAEGLPYDEVNRRLGGTPKSRQSRLTMTNTDHFVLRECDFKKPSDMDYINSNYSDPDGLVRRIPVFFTVSAIEKAIPHGFKAFSGSGQIRCRSFYDGDDLKFRYVEKSVTNPKESDWKVLDCDDEDEATKACGYQVTFSGMYCVNVVGLRGIGECIVPNRSYNGMGDAVAVLKKIKKRLGRFDGLLEGKPFFELCKVQEYVKHDGKKSKQWIITLELSVDPMEIERYAEPQAVATRAMNAMSMLTGTRTQPERYRTLSAAAAPPPAKTVDDLPDGLGDPDLPLQGEGVAPQAETRHQKGVRALLEMVQPQGLTISDMDNLAASAYQGLIVAELSDDQVAAFYQSVRKSLHEHGQDFVADVQGMRQA